MKRFTVSNITTWGLEQDKKYGGFKLPVSFKYEPTIVKKIEDLSAKKEAKNIFYGESKTVYFKLFELSRKQREDLLDQGRQKIDLSFAIEDVSKSKEADVNYLRLRVIGLRKSESDESQAPSDTV